MDFIKKNFWVIILLGFVLSFFWKFFSQGLLPIPSDTIVGLYHPFLDLYAKVSPQGVPFQNFLITDPVRQIIPWKSLVIDGFSSGVIPLWNPYEMAGKPLLANFQSSPFYPFNLLLFVKPFNLSWSIFIIIQPLLAGLFMFAYLKNLGLDGRASLLGSIAFSLSGFSVVWLEWGNIIHTALWLPLILLSVDKIFGKWKKVSEMRKNTLKISIDYQWFSGWFFILLFTNLASFFAGHLQTFFYIFILTLAYTVFRWLINGAQIRIIFLFAINYLLFFLFSLPQSFPTFQFINLSGRFLDQNPVTNEGWFVPLQHLVQFIAPDFFGNPATLNYWGVWNYAEFSGYVGVVVIFLAFVALSIKKQKEIQFFIGVVILSMIFAVDNPISQLPFSYSIPFISSAQPTRLIFLIDFALAVIAAFGFNGIIKNQTNKKWIMFLIILFAIVFVLMWLVVLGKIDFNITPDDLMVAKRNMVLPSIILGMGITAILLFVLVKEKLTRSFLILAIIALCMFDLFRFGSKFTPFTNQSYFYPQTKIIEFLKNQKGVFRVATTDSRILAPNISTFYKIQSIEGYDPLYLKSYAELIASSERENHSIRPPFGFNRIITPRNMGSPIIDLLNVKYVLTFGDLPKEKFDLVFSEGNTKVYENKKVFPRAFFITWVDKPSDKEDSISKMFNNNLKVTAIVEGIKSNRSFSQGTPSTVNITSYTPDNVMLKTSNPGKGFLVLTDTYYPTWKAYVDGVETEIYITNYSFRGIVVPEGSHVIEFKNHLL